MMTLISDGTNPGFSIAQNYIVGCSGTPLSPLKAATLMEEFIGKYNTESTLPIQRMTQWRIPLNQNSATVSESQSHVEATLEAERERIQIALEVMGEQIALDPAERDSRFQQIFHNVTFHCLGIGQTKRSPS